MLKVIEKAFNVGMLFYMTGALLGFVFGLTDGTRRVEANFPSLALQIALYAVVFVFVAVCWRVVLRAAMDAKWILALVAVAVASSAWSLDPVFSARRSLVLLATTVYGIYFGGRFTIPEQLRLLSWAFALVIFSNLFMVILMPQYGVDHGVFLGAWLGAFPQKNLTARAMVVAALVFFFARPSPVSRIRWIGVAASLCLVAASRSVTGSIMVIILIVIITVIASPLSKLKPTALIPVMSGVGALVIPLAFLIWTHQSQLLALVGRDSTLTGRTALWSALLPSVFRRPWLGFGFNAFWSGMQGASYSVQLMMGWHMLRAHSGFLDLCLDLGVLGLATFVAGYLVLSKRALQILRRVPGPESYWLCAFLCLMVLYNLDDGEVLKQNDIFWVLYTSTAVNIATRLRERLSSRGQVIHHEY